MNLGAEGELPGGILNFYNEGSLTCSMNVGGATTGSTCLVTYADTGSYQVTTQYIPNGATAVTETDDVTIAPYATTVGLTLSGPNSNGVQGATWTVTDQNGNTPPESATVSIVDTTIDQTFPISTGSNDTIEMAVVGPLAGFNNVCNFDVEIGLDPDWVPPPVVPYAPIVIVCTDSFAREVAYSGAVGWSGSQNSAPLTLPQG